MPNARPAILRLDDLFDEVQSLLTESLPPESEEQIGRAMGFLANELFGAFEFAADERRPVFVEHDERIIARIDAATDADAGYRVLEIEETDEGEVLREATPSKRIQTDD